MVVAVLFLVTSVVAGPGGHGEENHNLPVFEKPNLPTAQSSTPAGFLQRRDVPEALIDPYSVLGVLSFGVYIFYILYHRYQMGMGGLKHHMAGHPGNGNPVGGSNPPSGNSLFNTGSEQNFALILDMASKILSNAAKIGGISLNGTSPLRDTLDYTDDYNDLQAS